MPIGMRSHLLVPLPTPAIPPFRQAYEAGEQPKGKVKLDMCFCPEPELEDNESEWRRIVARGGAWW